MPIEFDSPADSGARIRIVGVGGGGSNAVHSMLNRGLSGVDFVAINTDVQALERNAAPSKVRIGKNLTRGLGAGADPSIGQRAAEEDKEEIARILANSDMVFVTAGMGGGTGTGGAPVVANIAKSLGALVVGIVTRPFTHEGKKRTAQAEYGIEELRKHVDTLIVIPNQRLLTIVEKATPIIEAFEIANAVLYNATRGISDIITVPGLINVDFADVRRVMREMGDALMGTGTATGENRAIEAAQNAISSPLLEGVQIAGAQKLLVNITGGPNLSLHEVDEATGVIHEAAGGDVEVIAGVVIDNNMEDEIMITVIATGFNKKAGTQQQPDRFATSRKSGIIDHIPNGVRDLQKLDTPTYMRRGIAINAAPTQEESKIHQMESSQSDLDKPAFLRRIMD
ncbi:MAG: cell division protein FtsZ [Bacteroidota bacterium]|nr:cell division protein FtsZ [Bacteroidota bacterium]